jgi:hypothetical protein
MNRLGKIVIVVLTVGSVTALLLLTGLVAILPSSSSESYSLTVSVSRSTCDTPSGFILIIANLSGFNDSIDHGAPLNPWPVIRVNQGDVVRLLVCNEDLSQAHGFAIQTYFDRGVVLGPGEAFRIQFQATLPGAFVIYCNIFCTVHAFMVGRLIVQSST